jgi:tripartite-type tricarboxylate transporter receptor subunit TctC
VIGRRAFLAAALALFAGGASAQAWPSKPIRIVVPFTPGGSTDILGRAIGQKLAESLGQQVIVENRPGAGGSIGAEAVARAAPDGYTLLMGHIGTLAVNPTLYPKLGYDPVKSFVPVAWVARVTNVLVVNPSVPAANVQELVKLARAQPGRLRYASGGNGSAAHLAVEYFKLQTQTDIVHVPYKGTGPAVTDLLGGQVEMMMSGAPALLPHVRAGKLRALAVTSLERNSVLPETPTLAESGLPGYKVSLWMGLFVPARTPGAVTARLNRDVGTLSGTADFRSALAEQGFDPLAATPDAFSKLLRDEVARWRKVILDAGLKPGE